MPANPPSPSGTRATWRPGPVVVKAIPSIALLAVILTHGTPLALAEIGAPFLPGNPWLARLFQAELFGRAHGSDSSWTRGFAYGLPLQIHGASGVTGG